MLTRETNIPQIVAIVRLTGKGTINLRKSVREYLGLGAGRTLGLSMRGEIRLSAGATGVRQVRLDEKNRVHLPEDALEKLQLIKGTLAALIERDGTLAVKRFDIEEVEGEEARWLDVETDGRVLRRIETNPTPEVLLPTLVERCRGLTLKYDVRAFLKGRTALEACLGRQVLGMNSTSDEFLRDSLICERLKSQHRDGSWDSSVTATARNLRELAQLGMDSQDDGIARGIAWLLARPGSRYDPGLWFASDELRREQERVINRRRQHTGKGPRERFKRSGAREVNLAKAGDPLIADPCGARIMWPSALALEALLMLDCEQTERVQMAMRTLTVNPHWCDNTYQHGLSDWKRTDPFSMEEISFFENMCIRQFHYGGVCGPGGTFERGAFEHFSRIGRSFAAKGEVYPLRMPCEVGEGCRIMMVRALSLASDIRLRRIVSVNLWQFAASLNFQHYDASNVPRRRFTDLDLFLLQLFAHNNHPVSRLVILRALRRIVDFQNKDGSWGPQPVRDATTHLIVSALLSLGESLPPGCAP